MKHLTRLLVKSVSIASFLLAMSAPSAHALDNIIRPYQGIRSSGMGGLLLTTGLYDENFFGNPARTSANPIWRLTVVQVHTEADYNFVDTARTLIKESDKISAASSKVGDIAHGRTQLVAPALYVPHLGRMSYAFGIIMSAQMDVAVHRFYAADPVAIVDVGPAFSVSETFMDEGRLAIGATAHIMSRANTKSYSLIDWLQGKNPSLDNIGQSGVQYDLDLGTTYRVNWRPLGFTVTPALAINNVLDGRFSNLKKPRLGEKRFTHPARQQPRTYGIGTSFTRAELWEFTDATFALEIRDLGNNADGSYFRLIHVGGEVRYGILTPRLGLNQGYWAAGLGVDLPVLKLDFATYGEEMSLNPGGIEDRRYAVQVGIHI